MNHKKRMDLSLFDQMIEVIFFSNFETNILEYAGAEVLPITFSICTVIKIHLCLSWKTGSCLC